MFVPGARYPSYAKIILKIRESSPASLNVEILYVFEIVLILLSKVSKH